MDKVVDIWGHEPPKGRLLEMRENAVCPYCGTTLNIVTTNIETLNIWACWGRCEKCGMSSGTQLGETEEEAEERANKYLARNADENEARKEENE